MRKVYHTEKSSTGLAISIAVSTIVTGTLFGILPFTHMIAKTGQTLELRKTGVAELPPPVEPETLPPPPEPEKSSDAPAEPQLAETTQQVPLSADLDVAMGSGGALAGFGDVRSSAGNAVVQNDTFDVSELEKRPEPISQVAPAYPTELRKAKIEGSVTLVFILTEEGKVEEARVENSSRPEFEKPALDAIRRWKFRPGMKEGQAVRTYIRIPMKFRMSSG